MTTNQRCVCVFLFIFSASLYLSSGHLESTTKPARHLPHSPAECRSAQGNCTGMVYPYLQNPQYMFPTSLNHVNDMCKMWSKFVDCIRRYISNCFEESRRAVFQKNVETAIDTVHAICSSKVYQNEYLAKATCFKKVSIDHCGTTYQQLIDVVSNANAKDEHICCHYAQFKDCVNRPLLEECGRKAKNLMDHSMSFLISRCNYYNYPTECSKPQAYSRAEENDGDVDFKHVDEFSPKTMATIQNDNKIDTAASSPAETFDRSMGDLSVEETEDRSQPRSSVEFMQASSQQPPITPNGDLLAENSLDTIETSESDGNSPEQLIVYTMKPESQIGSLGYTSASVSTFAESSIGHLIIGLAFLLRWIR